jgi:hypothetical protein
MFSDSVEISSFDPDVNEGLDLESNPSPLPRDAIARIQPGWDVLIRKGSGDLWVKVLAKESQGYVCEIIQQPGFSPNNQKLFARFGDIYAAAQGSDSFTVDGRGMSATRNVIHGLPGGGFESSQFYSVYSDGED